MTMNKQDKLEAMLRNLPEAADAAMGGLTATPFMKAKIDRAVEARQAKKPLTIPRWAPAALCAAMVLALALPMMNEQGPGITMNIGTLGDSTAVPVDSLSADLGDGGAFITAGRAQPGYRSIWTKVVDGSFPLIGVEGRYYRMLTTPRPVDGSLVGPQVGTVQEYTHEPSLSGTDVVLSNTAATGTPVYAVKGMDGALITAEVDGAMRLFQRVSFNGNALRGRETLADTLRAEGKVIAMELSGVGTITDEAACERLLATLTDCASYKSSGSISSKQALLIELDNGLVMQLAVRGDDLAACGVWSCPEFFEEFEDAMN